MKKNIRHRLTPAFAVLLTICMVMCTLLSTYALNSNVGGTALMVKGSQTTQTATSISVNGTLAKMNASVTGKSTTTKITIKMELQKKVGEILYNCKNLDHNVKISNCKYE